MKKRLPLIILSLLVIMAGLCGCAPSSQDTPLLWKVCDNDSYVYLFGSIHVATKDLYPLSNTIMDAYHSCDHLALEVSPDEMQTPEAMAAMAEYMRYDDGTLVTDVIGQDLFNEIVTILKIRVSQPARRCPPLLPPHDASKSIANGYYWKNRPV